MMSSFEGWVHSRVCRTYSVCVTAPPVSWNFNRVLGGQWQWYPRFWPHSKQVFSCLIAFGHPSPVLGR